MTTKILLRLEIASATGMHLNIFSNNVIRRSVEYFAETTLNDILQKPRQRKRKPVREHKYPKEDTLFCQTNKLLKSRSSS